MNTTLQTPVITSRKFNAYESVRQSGYTNMFMVRDVIELAEEVEGVTLTREEVVHIMKNYDYFAKKYI